MMMMMMVAIVEPYGLHDVSIYSWMTLGLIDVFCVNVDCSKHCPSYSLSLFLPFGNDTLRGGGSLVCFPDQFLFYDDSYPDALKTMSVKEFFIVRCFLNTFVGN